MGNLTGSFKVRKIQIAVLILVAIFFTAITGGAYAFTINVVGPDNEPIQGYRWLVEEDSTYRIVPGAPDPETALSVRFHKSYMTAAAKGDQTNSSNIQLDPLKHYFVSVMPDSGYGMGGAPLAPGQESVNITVNKYPYPTAQITVFVFEDNQPINNAPDLPQEAGLEGFTVLVFDTAGRYGQAGGQITQDTFGNPIGTTYNADGTVATVGYGYVNTGPDGKAVIKNLVQGKFSIQVIPPLGPGWVQTTTIEGTKAIDAWVKPGETPFLVEFGPPGPHVFVGFVKPIAMPPFQGGSTITGKVVNIHDSRPPDYAVYDGGPFKYTTPWIGLNDLASGSGNGVYAQRANPDGSFSIPNVPPGTYQLIVWDDNLDLIIAFYGVTVPGGGAPIVLGDVPVFHWFSRFENYVFYDRNQNGFRDCSTPLCNDPALDDIGMPGSAINLRFRDGTIYQSFSTDNNGFVHFEEVFPFFSWLIAEVDFARLKATGATVIVDDGGPVNPDQGWNYPSRGLLNPQPQFDGAGNPLINPNTGNNLSRTETGPVLLEGYMGFGGQTNIIEWGKSDYAAGENGGISGIIHYATTRAENDPAYAAAELWEPGIPRVQVNLYADGDSDNAPFGWKDGGAKGPEDVDRNNDGVFNPPDKTIDDVNGDGAVTLADIDNYPFGWLDGAAAKGPEDVDRNGDGVFDYGDALQAVTSDSFDDNAPTECQGDQFYAYGAATDCYDGLRNFNQIRPAVFDGGYAFNDVAQGTYIVEALPPRSAYGQIYETIKEEDKNVDFGDEYAPTPMLLPPVCVNYDENNGLGHLVPAELTLFPGISAPYAGTYRPLCDRKEITVATGLNAAVDFNMLTEVPVAGHIKGLLTDDIGNESSLTSPNFGEKYSPPFMPISVRDWAGKEFSRVYTDEWGSYNTLVPSSFTANVVSPSGFSPNMVTVCLNDPGPIPDPANPGSFMTDPYFNRQYSQTCYTLQFMPGTTTYLDTPLIPVAAFAGPEQFPLDCEYPNKRPKIYSVSGPQGGPYVPSTGQQITIASEGNVVVPNPAYDGPNGINPKTIVRDYGFGDIPGQVFIGDLPLQVNAWSAGSILATVPAGTLTGELKVKRGDNNQTTLSAVTVTVGPIAGSVISVPQGGSIQQAIDTASAGDLILVPPGNYEESVILWKPVRLQGWGPGSTFINAATKPGERLVAWRQKVESLVASGAVSLLPSQPFGAGVMAPLTLITEEGSVITVLAKDASPADGGFGQSPHARIDGFTISGAGWGGGVVVNGYAHYLEISNNEIAYNQGAFGGGIRIGHPDLTLAGPNGLEYQNSFNDHISIHNNDIVDNGGLRAAGGGVSLNTGSDFYRVYRNYICGNFTLGEGGGIGHRGLSDKGLIAQNKILFNQSFNQGINVSGGGILISGAPHLGGNTLSPGSGSVAVLFNLIEGNLAGAGDGGGIRTNSVNGVDVVNSPDDPTLWYKVNIFNNFIENNVAGLAGGGISMQDTARINIIHNTVVNNDSTGTAGEAFGPGSPNQSTPQPAGIVSRAHSDALAGAFGSSAAVRKYKEASNPFLANNIVWHNRSFYFFADTTQDPPTFSLLPDVTTTQPVYWDLWVLGTGVQRYLNPVYSILTDTTGYDATNISADPMFVSEYLNGAADQIIQPVIVTEIYAQPAFDEGGNFIDIRFGPLTHTGNYHLQAGSPAIGAGNNAVLSFPDLDLSFDIDLQRRPNGAVVDIGADEKY